MIIGDEGLRALTKRFAVDRSTLTRWLTAYTEAGREALRTLDNDGDGDGDGDGDC